MRLSNDEGAQLRTVVREVDGVDLGCAVSVVL